MKQVKLKPSIDELLTEISNSRKQNDHINSTKQGVVAELIIALHKKEVKQKKASQ